jgi:hypothetical protein
VVIARLILAWDLAGAIAQAGIDPTLEGRALQDAIRSALGDLGGVGMGACRGLPVIRMPHNVSTSPSQAQRVGSGVEVRVIAAETCVHTNSF